MHELPRWWPWIAKQVSAQAWGGCVFLLFLPPALFLQAETEKIQREMAVKINSSSGSFLYFRSQAALLAEVSQILRAKTPKITTLTVLPEGTGLNFLLRLPSPSYHMNFLPDHFLQFGTPAMLADLARAPADAVVILPRSTLEFGAQTGDFSTGYGREARSWLQAHYAQADGLPALLQKSGVEIYFRKVGD
jgi:hypothetical protein